LIITNSDDDRISKENMRSTFLQKYPDKHLTVSQVMTSLKDKGIKYNSKYRCENVQGCYVSVKYNNSESSYIGDNDSIFNNDDDKKTIKKLEEQIELLKDQMKKMEVKKIKKIKKTSKKIKPKKEIIEDDDEDEDEDEDENDEMSGLEMIIDNF
jgi:stress response protein YsnF